MEQNHAPPKPWADLDQIREILRTNYLLGYTPEQQFKTAADLVGVSLPTWRSLLTRTVHRQHTQV
jgi:hypothetical protein